MSKQQPIQITETYPDGMTREEYEKELARRHAKFIAKLLLEMHPEIIERVPAKEAV